MLHLYGMTLQPVVVGENKKERSIMSESVSDQEAAEAEYAEAKTDDNENTPTPVDESQDEDDMVADDTGDNDESQDEDDMVADDTGDNDESQDEDSPLARALTRVKAERAKAREELDVVTAELEKVRNELSLVKLDSIRSQIIHDNGLPAEATKFLHGETEEELVVSAEELRQLLSSSNSSKKFGVTYRDTDTETEKSKGLGAYLRSQL